MNHFQYRSTGYHQGTKNKVADMDDQNIVIRTKRREDPNADDRPLIKCLPEDPSSKREIEVRMPIGKIMLNEKNLPLRFLYCLPLLKKFLIRRTE